MSQGGANSSPGSGSPPVETLTGNSGGAVSPTAFNIDLLGNNSTGINIVGTPASSLMTVIGLDASTTQQGTVELATDAETTAYASSSLGITPSNLTAAFASPQPIGSVGANTGAFTAVDVDNITINGNNITSTNTNGVINLFPDGTGAVVINPYLTVGNSTQNNTETINGSAITSVIAAEAEGATDLGGLQDHRHSDVAGFGAHILGLRSRGDHTTPTVVQNNDNLIRFVAAGFDGTDYAQSAEIRMNVDNTPGANDMPGRIVFLTSQDGGQTPTEALRLNSSQNAIFAGDISTTAGSVTVDPGAATDSFIQFDEATTGKWRCGNDATDDSFRLSQGSALGTNDTFIMTSTGENTRPLQPAFSAYLGTTDSNVTGNGTTFTLGSGNALTEIFDQNSDFVTSGTFTAPVTGKYFFYSQIECQQATGATSFELQIITSNNTFAFATLISSLAVQTKTMCAFADMDATDTTTFTVRLNGIGADTADVLADGLETIVSGYLVC